MNKGVLYLLICSVIFGFGGFFIKMTVGMSSEQMLFSRAVAACIFLFVVAISTGKLKELKIKYPIATIIMGLVEGLSLFFYYRALETTAVTNTTLLVYIAPVFSVILSAIFLKERIEKKTILGIAASFIGVVIVSDPTKFSVNPGEMWGSIYALLGGFFYAAMAISSKNVVQKTTPLYATFWKYLVIAILASMFALPMETIQLTNNIVPILYGGWIAGGIAFLIYMKGITLVKGQVIQVITMFEIVVASLSGILLLGERPTVQTLFGGLFIVGGILIVSSKK